MFRRATKVLGKSRRACFDDVEDIVQLLNTHNMNFFNMQPENIAYDIKMMIKINVMSIIQLDIDDKLVGFLSVSDHPKVPHIHPSAWEDYVAMRYKNTELTSRNTLFVHMLCWSPDNGPKRVASALFYALFMADMYLCYVAMMRQKPSVMQLDEEDVTVIGMFRRAPPAAGVRGVTISSLPALLVLQRQEIAPRLRVRRAVEEDNDDIIPIVDGQSERLRQMYGDFYISELVARHPESERILLVAEKDEVAVGIMVLNTQINYDMLNSNFELSPFSGLRKDLPEIVEVHPTQSSLHIIQREISHQLAQNTDKKNVEDNDVYEIAPKPKQFSKVSMLTDTRQEPAAARSRQLDSRWRYLSFLDNEEVEFDIINIDTHLLQVPVNLSGHSYKYGDASDYESDLRKCSSENILALHDDEAHRHGIASAEDVAVKERAATTHDRDPKLSLRTKVLSYRGDPDAFIIELFALHPDIDERHGFDILEVSYEMFPHRTYAVLALPSKQAPFPLLEHFTLVTPQATRKQMKDQCLYVAHRNCVRGKMSVRLAEAYDSRMLEELMWYSPRRIQMMRCYKMALKSPEADVFLLNSERKPIGVVIVTPMDVILNDVSQIFAVPTGEGGEVRAGVCTGMVTESLVSSPFQTHARWFLRELLRHTDYDELLWYTHPVMPAGRINDLMSFTDSMVPVLPRLSVQLRRTPSRQKCGPEYALWHIDRPMTSVPKVDVNHNIVIVGASTTALSFIETLVFGSTSTYLTFTNITLVSPHGLPFIRERLCLCAEFFMVTTNKYTDSYFLKVPFVYYVNVIEATMIKIDRKNKLITLNDDSVTNYDDLYLMIGEQFQHPHHLRDELEREAQFQQGKPCTHSEMDDPAYRPDRLPAPPRTPINLVIINNLHDSARATRILQGLNHVGRLSNNFNDYDPGLLVVYGDCVEAAVCVQALVEFKVHSSHIVYVDPFPPEDGRLRVQHFNNEIIDQAVNASLEELKIQVYRGYKLLNWKIDHCNRIKSIRIISRLHVVDLPCILLFYYGDKSIDVRAFGAINSCGLVYDGGLVIDPQFGTNDPHVFAAGSFTRYSRQMHADKYLHRYYNSEDIGKAVGEMVLNKLDPFRMTSGGRQENTDRSATGHDTDKSIEASESTSFYASSHTIKLIEKSSRTKFQPKSVPKYSSPLVTVATLPGFKFYVCVRRPGPIVPIGVEMSIIAQGHTLTTNTEEAYCCVVLDSQHVLVQLTVLSRLHLAEQLPARVYGKHSTMLRQLLFRFRDGKIDDLYAFLTSPVFTAIYRDDFDSLLKQANTSEVFVDGEPVGSLYEMMRRCQDRYVNSVKELRSCMLDSNSLVEGCILDMLVKWLSVRYLPMYALSANQRFD